MTKEMFHSIGSITKKEILRIAELPENCKALILESVEPFPGYHGSTVPHNLEADSLFFVAKQSYSDDKIIRAIMKIKENFAFGFDAAPGNIYLNNTQVNIIRIKFLKYRQASELVAAFQGQGIELMKRRKIGAYESLINIRKHFSMEKSVEGIYHDLDTKEFSYLQIPQPIEWNAFEEITKQIKYNIEDNNFDSALCYMYDAKGILDFIRIYDKNFRLGKLIFIREKYLDFINKR